MRYVVLAVGCAGFLAVLHVGLQHLPEVEGAAATTDALCAPRQGWAVSHLGSDTLVRLELREEDGCGYAECEPTDPRWRTVRGTVRVIDRGLERCAIDVPLLRQGDRYCASAEWAATAPCGGPLPWAR